MSNRLKNAIRLIFKPLSKLLIKGEVSYGITSEILKTALVGSAEEMLSKSNEPITNARIHLMTGVHRKDVKRIRDAKGDYDQNQESMPLISQALSKWIGDPNFLNSKGLPRLLERKSNAKNNSFDDLINSLSKDVRPKSVLDEMISRKIVSINESGLIHFDPENIASNQSSTDLAYYLGRNINSHLEVAVENLISPENPQLERSAYFFGLSQSAAIELEQFSKEIGTKTLVAINEKAQELIKDPANHGSWDTNFGVYSYKKNQPKTKD